MRTTWLGLCAAGVFALAMTAQAQVKIEADAATQAVFSARHVGITAVDGIGVQGTSVPLPNYGVGVQGQGGYMGVQGFATKPGTGDRYGGHFKASGGVFNLGIFATAASGPNSYAGYFQGNVHVLGTLTTPSDARLKTDVRALDRPLDKLLALRPATYYFDTARLPLPGLPEARQIGLLAEDVESVLPELVSEIPVADEGSREATPAAAALGPDTYQSVNYLGLIPVLIGAIQEQQAAIEALQAALAAVPR